MGGRNTPTPTTKEQYTYDTSAFAFGIGGKPGNKEVNSNNNTCKHKSPRAAGKKGAEGKEDASMESQKEGVGDLIPPKLFTSIKEQMNGDFRGN
jgi:hypothetical protein